jgi:TorA maturation chaperone TorD
MSRAALFEIEALAFLSTRQELAEALASGEYAEALAEIAEANGLDAHASALAVEELAAYRGSSPAALFHELRIEHTHLFVGAPTPAVSPFAGIWFAREQGVEPLLFVNKESMDVERFLRSCGIGRPQGTNEPLDHIGTELEFLHYLCLLRAGTAAAPEGAAIPSDAYEHFYRTHFIGFAHKLAAATVKESRIPFYRAVARILSALPKEPF